MPSQFDPTQYSGSDIIYIDGVVYPTPMRFKTRDLGKGFPEVDPRNPVVEPWLAKSLESTADLEERRVRAACAGAGQLLGPHVLALEDDGEERLVGIEVLEDRPDELLELRAETVLLGRGQHGVEARE